ncbi:MAG: hemolysin III family protein, partial [Bacteroidota bacterium]
MQQPELSQAYKEELANTFSHALGLLFGLIAIPMLVALAAQTNNTAMLWGTAAYGFGFLLVYASSTIYHGVMQPQVKRWLNVLDHIAIYFMIAGSYTPFILAYNFNTSGIILLCILWGLVLIGVIFKLIFSVRYSMFSTFIYVLMGWLVIFWGKDFFSNIPSDSIVLLVGGGVAYSTGVVFFLWEKLKYNHAIWHIFV